MPRVKESSCVLCVVGLKLLITELCIIRQRIGKRIYFPMIKNNYMEGSGITFINLSETSALL